ncbi:MAG TPA: FlgD immunoglobulin-like domain containing protein, partial [Candidatus Edwardsbacteria bacterium]|nr:FlgD immunoglobulin-like domain containing protein [Candidatus Edwardsbacteria bacterium]
GSVTPGDKRFIMSSGPFNMAAGDSITLCLAVMCAWDRPSLLSLSDLAQTFYDNNFELGLPPAAPVLTVRRGDGRAYLSWTKAAETTPDPFRDQLDSTVGWHAYFKGTWDRCGDTLLIDSLSIRSDSAHETAIARGAPNSWGGYKSGDTTLCRYNTKSLYRPYDFQGYIVYRAMGVEQNLLDPGTRVTLGGLVTGSSGARGYFFDRNDGVQIVLDNDPIRYQTPDTTYYLPKYDTIGTDRGLVYAMVDSNLDNEWAYFYSVVAYDYQPDAYFTRTCPTTLASDPLDNYQLIVPRADPIGYAPPGIAVRVDGGCDARYGGALDHLKYLMVADPAAVPSDSFKVRWSLSRTLRYIDPDTIRVPVYKGQLYGSNGALLDSTSLEPRYDWYANGDLQKSFFGAPNDQLPFGGIIFRPYLLFQPEQCKVDTVPIITEVAGGSRTYPTDSVCSVLYANDWKASYAYWMWRGSDLEIRWRDTLVRVGSATADSAALTCTVWDVTNNVEIPFQGGLRKDTMDKPGWCFNYLPSASDTLKYIYHRNSFSNKGMFISGLTVFPNYRRMVGAPKNLVWDNRPETGDVWRIHCTGPRPPVDGNVSTFILTPGNPGLPEWGVGGVVMDQNAPNPFSDATVMRYQLKVPADVSLNIYNITGQLVRTLVRVYQAAGTYSVRWNGDDNAGRKAAAGVYLCQLRAGSRDVTKKIVLVR